MTAFYWDASGAVKRYRTEPGSPIVREIFRGKTDDETFATSQLLRLEMHSAAGRVLEARDPAAAARMLSSFLADYASFTVVSLSGQLAVEAAEYTRLYRLRALDALHFAAAMRIQQALPAPTVLVTSDRELVQAGTQVGLTVLDPTAPDAAQVLRRLRS